jgi:rod shape-determining protein MreC
LLETGRTRALLIALLVVAIALITIDFRDGGNSSADSIGGRVFGPVERLAGDVTGVFRGGGSSSEVANLQQQNDKLRAQLAQAQTQEADAAQLGSLLQLSTGKYQVVTGSVIAAGGDYSDTVTINVGSADGITTNETVLNGAGLVGITVSTTPTTATVQLATDAGATVGVRTVSAPKPASSAKPAGKGKAATSGKTATSSTATSSSAATSSNTAGGGQLGALTGSADSLSGSAPLKLTLFSANAKLTAGETLVTFGSDGGRPYVPGVPVGTVTTVTTQPGSLTPTALVTPFVDFTGLGVVGVVVSK